LLLCEVLTWGALAGFSPPYIALRPEGLRA